MSGIVERLRYFERSEMTPVPVKMAAKEAADEIERQQADLDKLLAERRGWLDEIERMQSATLRVEGDWEKGYSAAQKHFRELIADAASRAGELEAENKLLRAALQRLITDYQDVPDPTDADGQAVFEDARRALESPNAN